MSAKGATSLKWAAGEEEEGGGEKKEDQGEKKEEKKPAIISDGQRQREGEEEGHRYVNLECVWNARKGESCKNTKQFSTLLG